MLLTPFAPTRSFEGELLLKGMAVLARNKETNEIAEMIHPPEEAMADDENGHHHPAFGHDGEGNLLDGAFHPIDGAIDVADNKIAEMKEALGKLAATGDTEALKMLQDLDKVSGRSLNQQAIDMYNQKTGSNMPSVDSPEYRKNTVHMYPAKAGMGSPRLESGHVINYWTNKGFTGNRQGYAYESGAVHHANELRGLTDPRRGESVFSRALYFLNSKGVDISSMDRLLGQDYISPSTLLRHDMFDVRRIPTDKSAGGNIGSHAIADAFGLEHQMHDANHISQVIHHLPYEFFSADGKELGGVNRAHLDTTLKNMLQSPEAMEHLSQLNLGEHHLADYVSSPEGRQILIDNIGKKAATKMLFLPRAFGQSKTEDSRKKGSGPRNMLDRHIANLSPEDFARYQQHQGSIGKEKRQRNMARDIAALANTVGPHSDAPDRAHIHGNTDNHNSEDDHRDVIEHLAQAMMRQQGVVHHQPNMEQLVGQKAYEPSMNGVEHISQLQGWTNHTSPAYQPSEAPPAPQEKGPMSLFPEKEPTEKEVAEAITQVKRPSPEQMRLDEFGEVFAASAGWDSAKALARSDDLRKFWKCVR